MQKSKTWIKLGQKATLRSWGERGVKPVPTPEGRVYGDTYTYNGSIDGAKISRKHTRRELHVMRLTHQDTA